MIIAIVDYTPLHLGSVGHRSDNFACKCTAEEDTEKRRKCLERTALSVSY